MSRKSQPPRERTELLHAVGEAIRTHQNASDIMDDAVAQLFGINRTDLRCIDIIARLQPLTAGRLAKESGLSTGAVTVVIDRLERAGYARRVRDPADRRRVLVEVVPEVLAAAEAFFRPIQQWFFAEAARYSDEQLEAVCDLLTRGRDFLLHHAAWIREVATSGAFCPPHAWPPAPPVPPVPPAPMPHGPGEDGPASRAPATPGNR